MTWIIKTSGLILAVILAATSVYGVSPSIAATQPGTASIDKPIDSYQIDLLEMAFKSVSAMPLVPHIKDRSRRQEAVVAACLELDQPQRALQYTREIADWRRGAAYADLAYYSARHGKTDEASQYLALADELANTIDLEKWRREHIRVKMAKVYVLLGKDKQAEEYESGVEDAEVGKVAATRATISDAAAFDDQIKTIDALVATQAFDVTRNGLQAYVELYRKHYADDARRAIVEEKINGQLTTMPLFVRIAIVTSLAEISIESKDPSRARGHIEQIQAWLNSTEWSAEDAIPYITHTAGLWYQADDEAQAREAVKTAVALYDTKIETILKTNRAAVLRTVAEAYIKMQDKTAALAMYKRVISEGADNPNGRPRAADLSATCLSMALLGVKPDAQLWDQMRAIETALGDPW